MGIRDISLEELTSLPPFSYEAPGDPVDRNMVFAYELAYGANLQYWSDTLIVSYSDGDTIKITPGFAFEGNKKLLGEYIQAKWPNMLSRFDLLAAQGYLQITQEARPKKVYALTPITWSLLNQPRFPQVFISYSNAESAIFALLLEARLGAKGIKPYLDTTGLQGGEEWEKALENNIIASSALLVLIGPTTLASPYVQKEIEIALREHKRIIPVLHNGCRIEALNAPSSPFADVFDRLQCITVEGEKARYYNLAVLDVLNIFGVNP